MHLDLRGALEELADRGERRGGEAVLAAAMAASVAAADLQPARSRRRTGGRLVAASAFAAVVVAAVAAGGLVYLREKADDIATIDVSAALADAGAATPAEPMTVLVVGADHREGLSGTRADTIMLLRVDPGAGRAAVLSVPRDLWVPLAGQGREQRINTALDVGADVLVRTITEVLGVPIDHYVQMDFEGFRRVVDVLDGVRVAFPAPARDQLSGLDIPVPGCVRLDGEQALALVRSRHFQQQIAGRWVSDPTGDLGRIQRQQAFVMAVLAELASARNPLTVNRLADVAVDHLVVDDTLDTTELVRLAERLRELDLTRIPLLTVPATAAVRGESSVLVLDEAGAAGAVEQLLTGAAPAEGALPTQPAVEAGAETPGCAAG